MILLLFMQLILGSWLNMLGALLRIFGTYESLGLRYPYPLVMSGQTLCAVAQPLVIFAPTKMAALWFSENQRATANMIASMCKLLCLLFFLKNSVSDNKWTHTTLQVNIGQ